MKVHAASLGFLALFATLGLVVAQDPPAREPLRRPGQTAASQEREPDVRAITDLLASFVKAYNAKDAKALGALFTPDAEIEDEDGEITRGRDAIVARFAEIFAGERGRHARREHGLPALPGNRSCHRGGDGVPHGQRRSTSRNQPVQRDLCPPGRSLAPRQDPRRTARRGLPARAAPATGMDARRVGQRERRRDRQDHTASGRITATFCSGSSTSRLRGASP